MALSPDQLHGIDADVARRVLAYARTIAPCLDSLVDEPRADAIAILKGVARELISRGSRHTSSQSIGPARVTYFDAASCFTADDRVALRALCDAATSGTGPVGSFPAPSKTIAGLWPEQYS